LAARIRAECNRRGWSLGELARRAGISRTTLHHLERSRTDHPHIETLRKIAIALELPIEVLLGEQPPPAHGKRSPVTGRPPHSPAARDFDAATNPAVADVMRQQPHLFAGWTQSDVEELVSLFGTGGGLTPRGVELAAESINRRRETVFKLQVVLETHLRKDAMEMVDMLYRLVQPPQMREPESRPRDSE
jgi:transcriptional regulator with XRE-family HTH domain